MDIQDWRIPMGIRPGTPEWERLSRVDSAVKQRFMERKLEEERMRNLRVEGMEHLTREEILQLYETRGETIAMLDAQCKDLEAVIEQLKYELRYATRLRAVWFGEEMAAEYVNGVNQGEMRLLPEIDRLRWLVKKAEWAGKEEGYPVCPFCKVEFPGPHREGCDAFTAEGEVR